MNSSTSSPRASANPLTDFRFPELFIFMAQDPASHLPVAEDGLDGDGFISQNPGPVRHEGIPVCWVFGAKIRLDKRIFF